MSESAPHERLGGAWEHVDIPSPDTASNARRLGKERGNVHKGKGRDSLASRKVKRARLAVPPPGQVVSDKNFNHGSLNHKQ